MSRNKQQLEMGLAGHSKATCRSRSQQRRKRAQWWFNQMRLLVNSAPDWRPIASQRSEPTALVLSEPNHHES